MIDGLEVVTFIGGPWSDLIRPWSWASKRVDLFGGGMYILDFAGCTATWDPYPYQVGP